MEKLSPVIISLILLTWSALISEVENVCSGATCGECVSSDPSCSWCMEQDFKGERCQTRGNLLNAGCSESSIQYPIHSVRYLVNEEVRDSSRDNPHAIQVAPQQVSIRARPRKEEKIEMTFRAANNYPVDLYFLFDNSMTMKPHVESLGQLVTDIGRTIGDISSNYKMGYGIFQDKVILPFTDTSPKKLENPCITNPNFAKCAPPFEFKHLLSMTNNLSRFQEEVNKTEFTGNLDHPEGSTDAIMQAITCGSRIGWRPRSRKMLIFASNDIFHMAGDGRLAGIITPNDAQCHLDTNGKYSKELEQDYPSVSQLTEVVRKNEVHIIFAVPSLQKDLFELLSTRIPQSIVELLSSESDNQMIKDVIERKYKEMVSEVEMVHTPVKGVDIKIKATSSECEKQTQETNKCKGLSIGTSIKFDVEVKVTECPKEGEDKIKEVTIYPSSLRSDKLVLKIEPLCDCECNENSATWIRNSAYCSEGNGTLKCGLCDCQVGRYGEFCECAASDIGSGNSECLRPDSNSTQPCNGAGVCQCGQCVCADGYSGTYCECNDRACDSYQRMICGGHRGRCVCGQCECEPGYSGSSCSCPLSNETCIYDGKICNDVGTCQCGVCKCEAGYVGPHCENCVLCDIDDRFKECIECGLDGNFDDCPDYCPQTQIVDKVDETNCPDVRTQIQEEDGCFISFCIGEDEGNITLTVQRTTTCPESARIPIIPIVAGVVGGVVLVGLLLLIIWKIATRIYDNLEYSKFQEELTRCKWAQQDNPFYKGATTTYKNPMLDTSEPLADE